MSLGRAELHRKSLNPSEGTFGPHLDLGRLHCLGWGLGGPGFLQQQLLQVLEPPTDVNPKKLRKG